MNHIPSKYEKQTSRKSKAVGAQEGRNKAFAAIDENGDGKATKDELDAWLKNRAAKSPGKFTYKQSQTKGAFKKLDKNDDGTLSLQEWIKAPESKK